MCKYCSRGGPTSVGKVHLRVFYMVVMEHVITSKMASKKFNSRRF